ncbi:MAG: hypothetical protein KDK39_01905 [Leptospiraceae bacterium]|nr:hypothetical protein [Leptospiraceae bacterium]
MDLNRRLLFVFGKGGVGRSTISSALGLAWSRRGANTLIVQWSLTDSIGPVFGVDPVEHKHALIRPNLSVMNYRETEALREYFVEHLGMNLLYKFVIDNKQVSRLIEASPGLAELFFLGRLFWLVELAEKERGLRFERIIVDAPATGHGGALFGIVSAISEFQFAGPLIDETRRVTRLIRDQSKTGALIVTLPEEMPVDESLELIPKLEADLHAPPIGIFLNRSLVGSANGADKPPLNEIASAFAMHESAHESEIVSAVTDRLSQPASRSGVQALYSDLRRRVQMEVRLRKESPLAVQSIPDVLLYNPLARPLQRVEFLADCMQGALDA